MLRDFRKESLGTNKGSVTELLMEQGIMLTSQGRRHTWTEHASARFFGLIAIFKRIEEKYLAALGSIN